MQTIEQAETIPQDVIVPESPATPFYPALDGLRAIAVAVVFLVHYLPSRFPFGWVGVQIFFVLSGFLITGILFDTRRDAHRFRNFYARRALRIFPLYYGFLAVLALLAFATHGRMPEKAWLWAVYLENFWWIFAPGGSDFVFVHGHRAIAAIGHLWSLAVEEQFYFLWPPIVFWVRDRRRLMQVCVALIVFRIVLAAYWQTHLSPGLLAGGITYRMLTTQCDGFLVGGFLALALRGEASQRGRATAGMYAGLGLAVFAGLMLLLRFAFHWTDVWDYRSAFQATIGIPLINLLSGVLILAVIQTGSWAQRLCEHRVLRSLGRVSYGLYMFHLPVLVATQPVVFALLRRAHVHHLWDETELMVGTAISIGLAYASYIFYEKPFLRLKNRFTSVRGARERRAVAHPVT